MRSYRHVRWLDYYDTHAIMCARYYTSCCIQQNCQMHFIARSQALKTLSSTLPSTLSNTLPACLTIRSQVSSQNALKHSHEYALKYTPNCTRWHAPSLLDCTLPSKLSRRSQAHSRACSQVHSPEARHSQSHLTICSHVCSWVLDLQICWVAGPSHWEAEGGRRQAAGGRQEAGGGGRNRDVGRYHSLNLIFSAATATRSHDASRSWCRQLQPEILQER